MVIDVHAHAIPPRLVHALERDAGRSGVRVVAEGQGHAVVVGERRAGPLRQPLLDTKARLRAMDEAGIDLQLVSGWIGVTAGTGRGSRATTPWPR